LWLNAVALRLRRRKTSERSDETDEGDFQTMAGKHDQEINARPRFCRAKNCRNDQKSQRVMSAMLEMSKFDIGALKSAYKGD
jgi:hypothetical protein